MKLENKQTKNPNKPKKLLRETAEKMEKYNFFLSYKEIPSKKSEAFRFSLRFTVIPSLPFFPESNKFATSGKKKRNSLLKSRNH